MLAFVPGHTSFVSLPGWIPAQFDSSCLVDPIAVRGRWVAGSRVTDSATVRALRSADAHRESRALVRDAFGGDSAARNVIAHDNRRADAHGDAMAQAARIMSAPDAVALWRAGDEATHRAARLLACRGLRAYVVRAHGEDTTTRYVPVDPFARDASEAVSAAWLAMVHPRRAARRAAPATGEAIVAYLRASIRRMVRPMERVASRFNAKHDPVALARAADDAVAMAIAAETEAAVRNAAERLSPAERAAIVATIEGRDGAASGAGRVALHAARQKLTLPS